MESSLIAKCCRTDLANIVDLPKAVISACLKAPHPTLIVQTALDRLVDGGRIINISSAAATKPVTAAPAYSMAKAAINNLTHRLAAQLGLRGITANTVAPGFTRTDANAAFRASPELVRAVEAEIAQGRFRRTFGNRCRRGASGLRRWPLGNRPNH